MALRLTAVNRWCVTGTPIQKSIEGTNTNLVLTLSNRIGKNKYC